MPEISPWHKHLHAADNFSRQHFQMHFFFRSRRRVKKGCDLYSMHIMLTEILFVYRLLIIIYIMTVLFLLLIFIQCHVFFVCVFFSYDCLDGLLANCGIFYILLKSWFIFACSVDPGYTLFRKQCRSRSACL